MKTFCVREEFHKTEAKNSESAFEDLLKNIIKRRYENHHGHIEKYFEFTPALMFIYSQKNINSPLRFRAIMPVK